ncbi:MAG: PLP-dependent aminotransferase family protein [Acidimicrobiales bacterium]
MVKSPGPAAPPRIPLAAAVGRTGSSAIRDLLEITERPEVLSLAGGLPTPEAFPVAALAAATADVLADDAEAALQYGATEGFRPLRTWVADRYAVEVDEVTVTHGSQQALELLARATTDPGQVIALADPGYVGAVQAFRAAGATLAGIASDAHGLRVDDLAARLADGLRPTLVYVVADLDNPTGATLPLERRAALVDLAERYGFWIVDDDPYGTLRWAGSRPTPLRDLSDRVISLGTTSKMLCPGLRVGWAVAPAELSRAVVVLKQAADLHTGSLSQQVVHRLVTRPDGWFDAHLAVVRDRYHAQADALVAELRAQLGDRLAFRTPEGACSCGRRWPVRRGRVATSTRASCCGGPWTTAWRSCPAPRSAWSAPTAALRLSFATATPADLAEAVRRLARTLEVP